MSYVRNNGHISAVTALHNAFSFFYRRMLSFLHRKLKQFVVRLQNRADNSLRKWTRSHYIYYPAVGARKFQKEKWKCRTPVWHLIHNSLWTNCRKELISGMNNLKIQQNVEHESRTRKYFRVSFLTWARCPLSRSWGSVFFIKKKKTFVVERLG